ncbi:hypothetical protein WISP_73973 [Willisornis vidua]|uniref:Uncharacterized protein n=1 Tax=Willisornis vidua TaxID=1566151 RepID=A0ABQ9DCA3_9PASS|nr:hypothetical protein WISP_73973 [Willisornis vidua]
MQASKGHRPCSVPTNIEESITYDFILCLPCGYQILFPVFVLQKEISLYSLKNPKAGMQKTSFMQQADYVNLLLLDMLRFYMGIGTSRIRGHIQKNQKHSPKEQRGTGQSRGVMVSTPDSGSQGHEFESQWDRPWAVQRLSAIPSCQILDAHQGQPWLVPGAVDSPEDFTVTVQARSAVADGPWD